MQQESRLHGWTAERSSARLHCSTVPLPSAAAAQSIGRTA
jgi:hypothetical protein